MQSLRLFISVDMPKEAKEYLENLQSNLLPIIDKGKLVPFENLHVSLKFLGQVSKSKLKELISIIENLDFKEIEIELSELGVFSSKNPRIIWLKILGLEGIQKKVDEALSSLFPKENRFMGHLTLARIKSTSRDIKNLKSIPFEKKKFKIKMIKLKKSTLTSPSPVYTTLALAQAKNGDSTTNNRVASRPSSRNNNRSNSRTA